jgi:hypothetical protein
MLHGETLNSAEQSSLKPANRSATIRMKNTTPSPRVSPRITIAATLALAVTILAGGAITDGAWASFYYNVNTMSLQNAADAGAAAGSLYLPADPAHAIRVARECVGLNGVSTSEIASTAVSRDDRTITVKLVRALPLYLSGLAAGLSSRRIVVVSTAVHHSPIPERRGNLI